MPILKGEAEGAHDDHRRPDPVYVTGPIRVFMWQGLVHVCGFATLPDFQQVAAPVGGTNPSPRLVRYMVSHQVVTPEIAHGLYKSLKEYFEAQGKA